MTIGPEPITRTELMSSRLGNSPPSRTARAAAAHELGELGEQVAGVVGPGPASGWYCTENAGTSAQTKPSMTPSLRFTWLTSAWSSRVPGATA